MFKRLLQHAIVASLIQSAPRSKSGAADELPFDFEMAVNTFGCVPDAGLSSDAVAGGQHVTNQRLVGTRYAAREANHDLSGQIHVTALRRSRRTDVFYQSNTGPALAVRLALWLAAPVDWLLDTGRRHSRANAMVLDLTGRTACRVTWSIDTFSGSTGKLSWSKIGQLDLRSFWT